MATIRPSFFWAKARSTGLLRRGMRTVDGLLMGGELVSAVPFERCTEGAAGSFVGLVRQGRDPQSCTQGDDAVGGPVVRAGPR